jgi:hypothetical protein
VCHPREIAGDIVGCDAGYIVKDRIGIQNANLFPEANCLRLAAKEVRQAIGNGRRR